MKPDRRPAIAAFTFPLAGSTALLIVAVSLSLPVGAQSRTPSDLRTLTHDGRQRSYLVHDFASGPNAPLVFVLHGGGGNADNAVMMTGFDRVAARDRLIAVYPNGTAARQEGRLLTWNAGHCCAAAMDNRVDDVGFFAAMIDSLVKAGRVDPARIYVTGMSNGAMMAHRLGRELSHRIAAIAPVVGAVFGDEPPPAAPVSAFVIVGADDEVVPGRGGPLSLRPLLGRRAADRPVAPAVDQAAYWAKANGCTEPAHSETRATRVVEWRVCSSGAPVIFHTVIGNGHAWPGGRPGRARGAKPTDAFDATEAMWAFFKDRRRPR